MKYSISQGVLRIIEKESLLKAAKRWKRIFTKLGPPSIPDVPQLHTCRIRRYNVTYYVGDLEKVVEVLVCMTWHKQHPVKLYVRLSTEPSLLGVSN